MGPEPGQAEARLMKTKGAARLREDAAADPASVGKPVSLTFAGAVDLQGLLDFLATRALPGVEEVGSSHYARAWQGGGRGVRIRVDLDAGAGAARAHIHAVDASCRADLLRRVRRMFDIDRDGCIIDAALACDPGMAADIAARPGVRVPGAFDGFETAVRAVLGQQVSVAAARTLAGRLVDRFADDARDHGQATRAFPPAEWLAGADLRDFGMPQSRCDTLQRLAVAAVAGDIDLEGRMDKRELVPALRALKGIGPWTAEYIAMRCTHDPDCFPAEDLVLRREMGGDVALSAAQARTHAERWRPWRSYAVIRLWQRAARRLRTRS